MGHLLKTVRKAAFLAVGAVSVACMTSQAGATILVSGSSVTGGNSGGSFVKLMPGFTESNPDNTVGNDTFQTPDLYGFDEEQNIVLPGMLNVDDLADGLGGGMGAGSLAAGTLAASHYIFFDPGPSQSMEGTIEFDADILAVIFGRDNLLASDGLANTGVVYLNPTLRGLEAGDTVTITGLRTIALDWTASTPGDYIRVLTAFSPGAQNAVPEPVTATLGALGLGALAMATRRRRSA